jgi:hypothetical protein
MQIDGTKIFLLAVINSHYNEQGLGQDFSIYNFDSLTL